MKILVFDVGGTSIKYGTCLDGILLNVNEVPTNAGKGGAYILETLISFNLICFFSFLFKVISIL